MSDAGSRASSTRADTPRRLIARLAAWAGAGQIKREPATSVVQSETMDSAEAARLRFQAAEACRREGLKGATDVQKLAHAETLAAAGRVSQALAVLRALHDQTRSVETQRSLVTVLGRYQDWARVHQSWRFIAKSSGAPEDKSACRKAARRAAAMAKVGAEAQAALADKALDPFRYQLALARAYRDARLTAPTLDAYRAALAVDDGRVDWYPARPAPPRKPPAHTEALQTLGLTPDMQLAKARPGWVSDAMALNQALAFDQARETLCVGAAAHGRLTPWQQVYLEHLDSVFLANAAWAEKAGYSRNAAPIDLDDFWPAGVWNDGVGRRKFVLSGQAFRPTDNVFIFVNDSIIRAVNTQPVFDGRQRKSTPFTFGLRPDTLREFPRFARVSVGFAGGIMLNGRRSREQILYERPDGRGRLVRQLRTGSHIITKHGGFTPAMTQATDWQVRALDAYQVFKTYFRERFGYEMFVVYGILLGARRSGDFIATDDDFDMAYLSKHTSSGAVRAELTAMLEQIAADGWKMKLNSRRRMFKVLVKGVWLDCFSGWIEDGRVWMPQTTSFVGDESVFLPLQDIPFKGTVITIPNKPDVFLEAVYGPDWIVPDVGYVAPTRPAEVMEHLATVYLSKAQVSAYKAKGVILSSAPSTQTTADT